MTYFTTPEKTIKTDLENLEEALNRANKFIHRNTLRGPAEFIHCSKDSSKKIPSNIVNRMKVVIDDSLNEGTFVLSRTKEDLHYELVTDEATDLPEIKVSIPSQDPSIVVDETLRFYTVILV